MPLAINLLDDINDLRASGFVPGDVPEWNGTGWNSTARGSSPWTRTIIVDSGGKGDFTTIKDACDYVATQSPASATRWRILVLSGEYTEIPFTVPAFTSLIGSLQPISVGVPTDVRLYVNAAYPDGNFITLSSNSIVHGLTAYNPFSGTPSSDRVMFYGAASCAVTGCFVQMFNSANTYIYRHNHASGFTLAFNTFQANGATNVIVDVVLGGVTLANCNLAGIQTTLSAIFRNASSWGAQTIYNCVITGSPVLDISTSAGTTTVYGTNIKKISGAGTVINYDGTVNTKWGTKQAYAATDIPLTIKGATSQSANLIDLRDSTDALLGNIDALGKSYMADYQGTSGSPATMSAGLKSPWTRTVIVDSGGKGDFTTIKDACDYVATQSPSASLKWEIIVKPGLYYEQIFTIPTYTSVCSTIKPYSGNAFSYYSVDVIFNSVSTSGACITINGAGGIFGIRILGIIGTATGNTQVVSMAVGSQISHCAISQIVTTVGAYTHSCLSGSVYAYSCYISPINNTSGIGINATGLSTIQLCTIFPSANAKGYVQTSGDNTMYFNRFGTGAGTFFSTDITVSGGNLYINNTPYKTGTGNIFHIDRWFPTTAGVREAPFATDIPLTVKGATSQTANLIDIRNSADTLLASVDKDGKADMAAYLVGGVAGASGTFTTADSKTVTVTNGIITSIV